jgi:hypothetical protein
VCNHRRAPLSQRLKLPHPDSDGNCRISANPSVEIACLPMVTCGSSGSVPRPTADRGRPPKRSLSVEEADILMITAKATLHSLTVHAMDCLWYVCASARPRLGNYGIGICQKLTRHVISQHGFISQRHARANTLGVVISNSRTKQGGQLDHTRRLLMWNCTLSVQSKAGSSVQLSLP